VKDFSWSPTDYTIACWVPEGNNKPARVLLVEIPSRNVKRSHNLFKVQDCNLHWSSNGDYLCVKVDRLMGKKSTQTCFELCRIREKDIPIEPLQMTEQVVAFAWEPKGHKFAIVHSEAPSGGRLNVSIYSMANNKLTLQKTLEKKQASHLYWSPEGRYLVLAGMRPIPGILEFLDTHQTIQSLHTDQHLSCTDIQWDPTGRYVTTYVSQDRNKNENGYCVWSFRGKELLNINKDPFFQFLWRPRPKSLLSNKQLEDIAKPATFRKFETKYKVQDREKEIEKKRKIAQEMEKRKAGYKEQQRIRMERWIADAEWRKSIGIPDDREDDFLYVEECVEEVLSTQFHLYCYSHLVVKKHNSRKFFLNTSNHLRAL